MSFKTTGILAALLVILGAFWYFYDYRGEQPREEQAKLAKRLFRFDKSKVTRVFVATGDTMVVCERKPDSSWVITSPVRTGADRWAADLVAGNVEELDRADVISDRSTPELLKDYGLHRPGLRVYLEGVGIDTVLAGDDTPTGGFTYVKLAGKPEILTVGAWQISRMRKTLFDLRDKTALPFERDQVGRVEINAPGGQVVLTRNGQTWGMERPVVDRADEGAVSLLLTNLSGSKVRSFRNEAPAGLAQYGLAPPRATVSLFEGQAMTRRTLLIGDPDGGQRLAKYELGPPVFTVDTSTVSPILSGASEFRHKAFAEIDRERATGFDLARTDSTIACERDTSGDWRVLRPFGRAIDRERGDALLTFVNDLKAKAFVAETVDSPAEFGFDRPFLTVRVSGKGGPLLILTIGKPVGDRRYARVDRRPNVFEVDTLSVRNLWPVLKEKK